jgi:A1 cistron-splicing factor AAR2
MINLTKSRSGVEHMYIWFFPYPEPIGGEITIARESSWMDKAPQSDMERCLVEQLGQGKFAKNAPVQSERRVCYYTSIPASVKHKNASGDELTAMNLDKVMF